MRAVQTSPELGADASGQFSGTQAFDGILGNFPLPLRTDGGRVDKCYPVDDLQEKKHTQGDTMNQRT